MCKGYSTYTFTLIVDATKTADNIGICQSHGGFIAGLSFPNHIYYPQTETKSMEEYRASSLSQVDKQEQTEPSVTEKCPDMAIEIAARKYKLHSLLLNDLIIDEQSICEVDLDGLDSASVVDLGQDNISLSSIDDFNNMMESTCLESRIILHVSLMTSYHKIVCARVSEMTPVNAMEYVGAIADGMAELGMKDSEKGVDSVDTKQKTLFIRWMSERASLSLETSSVDKKFHRNVVIKLFNKKGKTKRKNQTNAAAINHDANNGQEENLLIPGHFCILCAFNNYYNKFCPRLKNDNGR